MFVRMTFTKSDPASAEASSALYNSDEVSGVLHRRGMSPTTPSGPFGDGRKCSWPHEKAARGTGPGLPARVINGTRSGRARPAPPD